MINFKLWRDALVNIPRIDTKKEWDALDVVSKWLISTRAAVLLMTALTVVLGGFLAFKDGIFNTLDFLLCLIGLVFAHASNNLINDWVDHKKKIDDNNYYRALYGTQALECGYWSFKQWFNYLLVTGSIALICGILLIFRTDISTLYLMLIGIFFVLFYTWPLKYIGLGEPTVLLVWGPLMVCGSYFVCSGGELPLWNPEVILISIIYAFGPTNVLFGKHIDKILDDRAKQVYTMPVIMGQRAARFTAVGFWLAQYILCFMLFLFGYVSWVIAIVLFAIPAFIRTIKVFQHPRPTEVPKNYPPNVWPLYFSAYAFTYNKTFGGLFILALLLDFALKFVVGYF